MKGCAHLRIAFEKSAQLFHGPADVARGLDRNDIALCHFAGEIADFPDELTVPQVIHRPIIDPNLGFTPEDHNQPVELIAGAYETGSGRRLVLDGQLQELVHLAWCQGTESEPTQTLLVIAETNRPTLVEKTGDPVKIAGGKHQVSVDRGHKRLGSEIEVRDQETHGDHRQ